MDKVTSNAKQPVYTVTQISVRETTSTLATDLNPAVPATAQLQAQVAGSPVNVAAAENEAYMRPTPGNFLDLSLAYYQTGRFQECIAAARKALGLRPKFAEAHNNISAAYQCMGKYDQAIASARDALRIAPNYRLAKNNLALSLESKRNAQ